MHFYSDLNGHAGDKFKVSICSLGLFGTKYVRDVPVPSTITIRKGDSYSQLIAQIYSFYEIGTKLAIDLR